MKHPLIRPLLLALAAGLFAGCGASSSPQQQDPPEMTLLPLDDLSSFRPVASNWKIAGAVASDSSIQNDLRIEPGAGVLVNMPSEEARDNIFTTWEHGDLELELDFLVPKGSNSGVYLQGRYEVQVFDSWNVADPGYTDAGGIYQRWDESRPEGQRGYEGHAPRSNASRPPGDWQHFRILFQAPRFDENGVKLSNARFVLVEHNGVVIHEQVEVTGPTRAAAFEDEQATGPLMLQGDHGPVAYRNIRYRMLTDDPATSEP